MFNVDGKEFIFLVLIALVVLGPEKLPDLFRRAGKAYSEFRRLSEGFQEEFRRAVEEPIGEAKATGDLIRESVDLRTTVTTEPAADPADERDVAAETDDPADPNSDGAGTETIDPRVHEVELPSFGAADDDTDTDTDDDDSVDAGADELPDRPPTATVQTIETVGTAEFEVIDADVEVSRAVGRTTADADQDRPRVNGAGPSGPDADRATSTHDDPEELKQR